MRFFLILFILFLVACGSQSSETQVPHWSPPSTQIAAEVAALRPMSLPPGPWACSPVLVTAPGYTLTLHSPTTSVTQATLDLYVPQYGTTWFTVNAPQGSVVMWEGASTFDGPDASYTQTTPSSITDKQVKIVATVIPPSNG